MKYQKKNFFKRAGAGFYIVLCLCLVAVGIAAWSTVSVVNDYKNYTEIPKTEPEAPEPEIIPEVPQEPVDKPVENEPYEQPEPEPEQQPKVPVAEYFLMPVKGNIIKVFDDVHLQYSQTLEDMRLHTGIDIEAAVGTDITAAGDGTVTEIYPDAAMGYTVIIDHGNGIVAKYCGLNEEISVKSGDAVTAGTKLGTLGSIPAENGDAAHLHFEIYDNGRLVPPLKAMGMED